MYEVTVTAEDGCVWLEQPNQNADAGRDLIQLSHDQVNLVCSALYEAAKEAKIQQGEEQ